MSLDFYDRIGNPVAYTEDGVHVFTFEGYPVGYFHNDSLYSYAGQHLGRMINGWVRDNRGHVVFFTADASGGPTKPIRRVKPIKRVKQLRPLKGMRQLRPLRPVRANAWSERSGTQFFV